MTALSESSKASVYSITGKMILDINLDENTTNKINVDNLSSGLYLLKIHSNSNTKTIKFIKI